MTETRLLGRRSRRLAVLLLAVTGRPAVTLVWLGLQLLQQERSLQAQRGVERQQAALGHVIRSLEGSLADAERHIVAGPVPDGMTRLTLSADGVIAEPANRVLWVPARRRLPVVESRRFADAERLEFQGQGVALASYQHAAQSSVATVRAGALLRVARVLRRQEAMGPGAVGLRSAGTNHGLEIEGAPSDLQARRAFVSVLEEAGGATDARGGGGAGGRSARRTLGARPAGVGTHHGRPGALAGTPSLRRLTASSSRRWPNSCGTGGCASPRQLGTRFSSSTPRR